MTSKKINDRTLAQLERMTARMARRRGRSYSHMNRTRLDPDPEPYARRIGKDHRSEELVWRMRAEELLA